MPLQPLEQPCNIVDLSIQLLTLDCLLCEQFAEFSVLLVQVLVSDADCAVAEEQPQRLRLFGVLGQDEVEGKVGVLCVEEAIFIYNQTGKILKGCWQLELHQQSMHETLLSRVILLLLMGATFLSYRPNLLQVPKLTKVADLAIINQLLALAVGLHT